MPFSTQPAILSHCFVGVDRGDKIFSDNSSKSVFLISLDILSAKASALLFEFTNINDCLLIFIVSKARSIASSFVSL